MSSPPLHFLPDPLPPHLRFWLLIGLCWRFPLNQENRQAKSVDSCSASNRRSNPRYLSFATINKRGRTVTSRLLTSADTQFIAYRSIIRPQSPPNYFFHIHIVFSFNGIHIILSDESSLQGQLCLGTKFENPVYVFFVSFIEEISSNGWSICLFLVLFDVIYRSSFSKLVVVKFIFFFFVIYW